ncbi:RAS oncogene family member Rab9 [Arctopsyche grandis]|uniref:RAS oncogene family member Rab9 n=1 Tax=Arctopsyche grandis TaxID=121162 RepID=UPI00406D90AD
MSETHQRANMRNSRKSVVLKVVILGDGGVGKSCLMNRFVSNRFDDQSFHTIGVEFLNKDFELNGDKYTLQIWDTAGQERFKSLRTPFYRGTDICLLTYAVDDKASFHNMKVWMEEFKLYADVANNNENFPFIVVGNKSDKNREVSTEQMADWCSEYRISSFIETSAKTSNNVVQAFKMAVQRWLALERMAEKDMRALTNTDSINLENTPKQENKIPCCVGPCRNE